MKKIYILIISIGLLGFGSCFQKLDQDPEFNYPEQPPITYSPRKLALTFEDKNKDMSNYHVITQQDGNITYPDGKVGKCYQGAEKSYILVKPSKATYLGDISLRDTIAHLESFTVAFWMKANESKTGGLFTISDTKDTWGNLDIFLSGNNVPNEGFFKIQMAHYTERAVNGEKQYSKSNIWYTPKIANTIGDWVHLAFRYDIQTRKFDILRNGEVVATKDNFGTPAFHNMGPIVIGTFGNGVTPPLAPSKKVETWMNAFPGELDQFYFYNKALSDEAIKALYNEK
jgi:hypothetical protein